jgi:C_GCAxxG_C_C family probable redox protein
MEQADVAVKLFGEGYSCSQAILAAYGELFGIDGEACFRIAGTFGGGMGRTGQTCGAVTGALMVIGLAYVVVKAEYKDSEDRKESNTKAYDFAGEFMEAFTERNGSVLCRGLLGFEIATPEGLQRAKEICPKFVQDAAQILDDLLEET